MTSPHRPSTGWGRVFRFFSRLTITMCFLLWLPLLAGASPGGVVEVDPFEFTSATVEINLPDGSVEPVALIGPGEMHVYFEGANEGDALDDDGDGLDEVVAELAELQLWGASPVLGPVVLGLEPASASLGVMEEQVNATPGLLDVRPFAATGFVYSFFDVFLEIELAGLQLHNVDPVRLGSVISNKPPLPNETYESVEDIPLYDSDGNATEIYLVATNVTFLPEPRSGLLIAIAALSILNRIFPRHQR